MARKKVDGIGNSHEEKPDRYEIVDLDTSKLESGNYRIRSQIRLEDGTIKDYIKEGGSEMTLMHALQAHLANMGSRKSDLESDDFYNQMIPVGEIRDVVTPHDLAELR